MIRSQPFGHGNRLCFVYFKGPVEAVRKLALILNKDLSDDLIRNIADKCSFTKLKHVEETQKQHVDVTKRMTPEELESMKKKGPVSLYRKGKIEKI